MDDPTLMAQDAETLGFMFMLILAAFIIPFVFYCITLQKALQLTGENNRTMQPGLVWLNFIPLFSLGWHFYTILKISESIQNAYKANGLVDGDNGGKALGLAASILFCCTIIPFIGGLVGIAALIVWIIYWVKIAGYNKQMAGFATQSA